MAIDPRAGQPAPERLLVDVDLLLDAYYTRTPDVEDVAQRVRFGTSGHRGSSLRGTFNEAHVLAITQAICDYRSAHEHRWPVVSRQGHACALGAGLQDGARGAGRQRRRGDDRQRRAATRRRRRSPTRSSRTTAGARHAAPMGSSSHPRTIRPRMAASNTTRRPEARPIPASRGGSRRDRMSCWPTSWIRVRRIAYETGAPRDRRPIATTMLGSYVSDLGSVVDMDVIKSAGIKIGVDPLGGASVDLLGPDRRALRDRHRSRQRRRGPDVPLHAARLGRQDPHGLLVAIRHGEPDRAEGPLRYRLRQRPRRRPPRHRHAERRPDESQSLSRGGDLLSVHQSPGVAPQTRRSARRW